jgi:aminopeptidase N
VAGKALQALTTGDRAVALDMAKRMVNQPAKGKLVASISTVLSKYGDESSIDLVTANFAKMPLSQAKFQFIQPYADMLGKVSNTEKVKKGIDLIVKFRDAIPKAVRNQTDPFINNILTGVATKKQASGQQEQADYIKSKVEKTGTVSAPSSK